MRTPSLGVSVPRARPLPDDAAPWMKRARRMVMALEAAIQHGELDAKEEASIERAWAAWELGGVSDASIERVAHLVDRAYVAIHGSSRAPNEQAILGCANILYKGLPRIVRRGVDLERIVAVVRTLRNEPELWPAVVRGTAAILGWNDLALGHAAHAVRVAMKARKKDAE